MTLFAIAVRAIAAYNVSRFMRLRVEGAEHLPSRGAAVVAARHYHHLFDGAALVHGLRRQPHIFVALDWAASRFERALMETVCRLAAWPVALRGAALDGTTVSAFDSSETLRYVRRAIAFAATLLRRGKVVAIFPEGYPTIDPVRSRKAADDEFLPFAPGLLAIVARAQRGRDVRIPIVPVGFTYVRSGERYDVTMRLGAPLFLETARSRGELLAELECRVRALSS
ncbi:MAG: 1-acyl-sn-glycerol-3-phosphate acyltransferase [Candidatus Eremiobacteraeota bacterium]|nr:1-acyl-sn-glycerol-3-phosphate acyltransferase [Candidatus Eremiobacteraeota bacterium]